MGLVANAVMILCTLTILGVHIKILIGWFEDISWPMNYFGLIIPFVVTGWAFFRWDDERKFVWLGVQTLAYFGVFLLKTAYPEIAGQVPPQ